MTHHSSHNQNVVHALLTSLPTYLPLPEAAKVAHTDVTALQRAIELGTLQAINLDGEIAVSANDVKKFKTKEDVPEYKQAVKDADRMVKRNEVRARLMGIAEAARTGCTTFPTVQKWIAKGYVLRRGEEKNKILVDLADVLYCKAVHDKRGGKSGAPLLNADGTPYVYKTKQLED